MQTWIVRALMAFSIYGSCFSDTVSHSRQKRVLWITEDGRLALPPGTTMVITPSVSMPLVRYPLEGFLSNVTLSFPFTIDFDKLGLTDNENPYGILPPLLARSMGRAAGSYLADYVGNLLSRRRGKRDIKPENTDIFHGGERALLYIAIEDFLQNLGMDGKACLLRAICEVHANTMRNYGLFGEVIKLFLSASKSPFSEVLKEYVEAENAGRKNMECWPYMKDCPKSLFRQRHNHYSEEDETNEDDVVENEIDDTQPSKVTYKPTVKNM